MDILHPEEFEDVIECSDYTALSPWHCSDAQIWKENVFLSVTGCCLELPADLFEEGEEEWSSGTNSLLMLLRSLIMELCNRCELCELEYIPKEWKLDSYLWMCLLSVIKDGASVLVETKDF